MSFHASYVCTSLASLKTSWLKESRKWLSAYLGKGAAPSGISQSPRRTRAQREVPSPAWDRVSVCAYLAHLSFSNKRKEGLRPSWHIPDQPAEPEMLPHLSMLLLGESEIMKDVVRTVSSVGMWEAKTASFGDAVAKKLRRFNF
jgi:hypothetical protein